MCLFFTYILLTVGTCWPESCNDSTSSDLLSNCTSLLSVAVESCRNHSGPPDECFWNQYSRVTGIFCKECEKLCRSERTSLNFVQLLIGLAVFSPAFAFTRITMSILASDGMGKEGQVCNDICVCSHTYMCKCVYVYSVHPYMCVCACVCINTYVQFLHVWFVYNYVG